MAPGLALAMNFSALGWAPSGGLALWPPGNLRNWGAVWRLETRHRTTPENAKPGRHRPAEKPASTHFTHHEVGFLGRSMNAVLVVSCYLVVWPSCYERRFAAPFVA